MMRRQLTLLIGLMLLGTRSVVASSQSISTQTEFRAGIFEGTEAESAADKLKLKTAGSWEQRAWQTPDIPFNIGTATASDGEYVYSVAGVDTWFARYNPDDNQWHRLANAPFTTYYGADMVYHNGYMYTMFGGYQNLFARYNIALNTWEELAEMPDLVYRGGSLDTDGTDIYATRGYGTTDFWKYSVLTNSWTVVASTPASLNQGASLSYYNGYFYTPRGGNTTTYYRFEVATGLWSTMAVVPGTMNEETNSTVRGEYIYILRNNNTNTMYRYSPSGNSWVTLANTPQTTRYVGLSYNESDDTIYVIRGNNTYDMWKYDADLDSYSGPADLSATPGSGADLLYYGGYLYQPRGNNSTSFYRYNPSNNTWESREATPIAFNDDTTGVVAGLYLYFFQGSNTTNFYRYDPAANTWSTMTATPATVRYGGSLAYPGSGDYIYATRGNFTRNTWRYSISANSWDDPGVAELPDNAEASYGARLLSDGTDLYYLSGSRTGAMLRYTIGTDTWSAVSLLPYAPYWGTDAVYYSGNIYVQGGYYKDDFFRYNIASGTWTAMDPLQQYYGYDNGAYNGGSLAVDSGSGVLYSIIGANILNMATFTVSPNDYLASGTWTSAAQDLSYVTSWEAITEDSTVPTGTNITYETRTSADRVTWSTWETATGGTISSPTNRYIQIRVTLAASPSLSEAPVLNSVTINYQGDVTAPTNPSSFTGKSQEVGGATLTSGNTYNHNYPYFSWSGAVDSESGVAGYYVYFGTNSGADPAADGSYQENSDYLVTTNLSNGSYYLLLKIQRQHRECERERKRIYLCLPGSSSDYGYPHDGCGVWGRNFDWHERSG